MTNDIRKRLEENGNATNPTYYNTLSRADIDHLFTELDEARDLLKKIVLWHGGVHHQDCPEDDTCNCEGKPINDRINRFLTGTDGKTRVGAARPYPLE